MARIESHNNSFTDSGDLRFYTVDDFTTVGGALERMRITETGNVGIGTPVPSATLDVLGTTELDGDVTINSNLTVTDTLFVDAASGNVGIGTTAPAEALHVSGGNIVADRGTVTNDLARSLVLGGARSQGNAYATLQFQNFDFDSGGFDYIGAEIRSHNDGNVNAGDLSFFVNDGSGGGLSQAMRINRHGLVGIGTPVPGVRLDVRGEIRFDPGAEFPLYPAAFDRKTVIVAGMITRDGFLGTNVTTSSAIETTGRTSDGHYTFTFRTGTFTPGVAPIVTVTAFTTGNSNNRFVVLESVTATTVEITIRNDAGTARNAAFNFIAIGERN